VDPGLGREDMVHNNTTEDYITSWIIIFCFCISL
jgi:hypothetical protein